jgi:hypothetical protein
MAETESETAAEPMRPLPWALIGLLVAISGFLEWAGRNFPESRSGFEIPAKFIIDSEVNLEGAGLSIGVPVVILGLLALVGALVPRVKLLLWVGAAAAVVIALLFAFQLNDFTDRVNKLPGGGGFGLRNTVGVGAVLAGLGGLAALAGAALGLFAARRGPDATQPGTRGS